MHYTWHCWTVSSFNRTSEFTLEPYDLEHGQFYSKHRPFSKAQCLANPNCLWVYKLNPPFLDIFFFKNNERVFLMTSVFCFNSVGRKLGDRIVS